MKSFARRTDWQLQPNELARRLSARRAAGLPLLDLTESNPTRCRLAYPEAQIRAALNSPALLRYSPDPRGLAAARQSIAASYYGAKGEEVKPEQLLLTASTSEAYAYLFRLLAEPGDELLVPRPGYPLFDFLAQICDLKPVSYALAATRGWRIERSSLLAGLGERTRAILAVSPNNPTGSFLASADRDFLLALCAERGLALIVDEVFADYSLDERIEPPCWPAEPPTLLFRLNGLSKTLGLPQLKLSWIYASGPPELLQAALGRLEIIADTFLSVNTPVQLALPRLLELRLPIQGSIRERLRSNLAKLKELAGRS
ncbi:MAG TPA: pyridoxal phosphate-dependent aminotransferase, partial [Candidatus Fraserbacteria bacterium]|nr:pyridoxal phosphate-dependent aminotransferase [Candidatus Fraserbacteria bacterium]